MGRRRTLLQVKSEGFEPPLEQPPPFYLSQPRLPSSSPPNFGSGSGLLNLNDKVSPSMLLVIIILAIVFFVSGLIHLLVRFLWRPQSRDPDDLDNVSALQGQLQQLFHLHDAGVDQSFIDNTLPVFHYKAIIGLKDPFDCAVCLCEFDADDKLRLLPKCSHAFHMECIDTWLLSHSTCPLCRACLLSDFSPINASSPPFVFVLESGSDSSREIVPERESTVGRTSSVVGDNELGLTHVDLSHKSFDLSSEANPDQIAVGESHEKVVTVKLGKFRNVDSVGEGSSTDMGEARRCLSMGSFAYVMDENSSLQVPVRATMKKQSSKKRALPLTPGRRIAMSECDCESTRDFQFTGFDAVKGVETSSETASIERSRKESFSVSKIWLRGKAEKPQAMADSSRRAVSFRFSAQSNEVARDDSKAKNGKSEMEFGKWENDDENQSCYSVDSQGRAPSFARRTLLWLTGKQNKVVHSSSDSNF
ncbi:RING-H2 finger protein ATL13-like [Neltuma alba]|uniref:RING-H2 finger protein ATL13-like n=1 Tax=Neltuma alba TaxID=207710 RepID=UPI0010A32438|nr:RING-H2 finger protein ATL13-like [Prosopis alba]XP_028775418.1 RING-H2 finger protein ATL13-like [Prosopis alba]XP_028775420.1 RING-H2 finger protein ATL13-like [Prosopis alba]